MNDFDTLLLGSAYIIMQLQMQKVIPGIHTAEYVSSAHDLGTLEPLNRGGRTTGIRHEVSAHIFRTV